MQLVYSFGDIFRVVFGPVAAPLSGDPIELFNPNLYYGGALTLYACGRRSATRRSRTSSERG